MGPCGGALFVVKVATRVAKGQDGRNMAFPDGIGPLYCLGPSVAVLFSQRVFVTALDNLIVGPAYFSDGLDDAFRMPRQDLGHVP